MGMCLKTAGWVANNVNPDQTLSGLPQSGKNVWKMKFFPGQGKVREFWFVSGKLEKTDKRQGKSGNFKFF